MKKIFIFLFLTSCISVNSDENTSKKNFNFEKNLSFIEFNNLLTEYAEANEYPDIDE